MKRALILIGLVVLVVALGAAPPARADSNAWSQGVPVAQQDKAIALFEEGNTLFATQAHAPALAKYRAAIALWDHPLIRFNLAVTLIRLDRPLEAADELDKALRYGDAPFKKELYQQALDYQALLKGRVGYIEATCDQAGAAILLDGKPWFSCPGTRKLRVMTGEHALVGELSGFLSSSQRIVVAGGATATHKLALVPLEKAVRLDYPYRRWIPYTVTATGAAIALGGLGFWLSGRSQMSAFETNFARDCPMGCLTDLSDQPTLRGQRDSAELKGKIGITMMISGGAVAVGGIVMAIINRPKRVLPPIELAPTAGGMAASTRWTF